MEKDQQSKELIRSRQINIYENSYMEICDIDPKDRAINARPVTRQLMKDIIQFVHGEETKKKAGGMIDRQILFYGEYPNSFDLVWIVEEDTRKIYFKEGSVNIIWPRMLLYADERILKAFVINSTNTILYKAPFGNYHDDYTFCNGNMSFNKEYYSLQQRLVYWESFLYDSLFTHGDHNYKWWKKRENKQFDYKWTKQIKKVKTSQDIIAFLDIS